jgi:hypothetical protein
MHPVEADIRKWSHDFLEVSNKKLNGLPPCPYAKQAWLDDKVSFSINTGLEGLIKEVTIFELHNYDIVVWANQYLPDMEYLDGYCDGINEAMSIAGKDMHLMVFHPDYDAEKAGLDFLIDEDATDEGLVYCMVFVQRLSTLDDAALSLEKSGYYEHFPEEVYKSLVLDRRELRNGS